MPGTPFTRVQAQVPALDSFGLETDLRVHSHGDAFCLQQFRFALLLHTLENLAMIFLLADLLQTNKQNTEVTGPLSLVILLTKALFCAR